jgi:hypothetical protein
MNLLDFVGCAKDAFADSDLGSRRPGQHAQEQASLRADEAELLGPCAVRVRPREGGPLRCVRMGLGASHAMLYQLMIEV